MYAADELFRRVTGRKALGNITHIDNIPSIMQRGILCHEHVQKLKHRSIALEDVQDRRHRKRVPNGLLLHQYACLYFSPRNPMMFYRKCHTEIFGMIIVNILEI